MTSWLVCCTAQIPLEVLDAFINQSTQGRFTPKDPSPWILQQKPTDPITGPCFSSPAPTFETGFKEASISSIQEFVTSNINGKGDMPDIPGELSNSSFVVLDARSIVDHTCEVHYRWDHMPEGEWLEYDKGLEIQEWKSWRVRFRVAWPLLAGLEHGPEDIFDMFEAGEDAYIDEKGVAQLAFVEQDTYEFPEFEDRAPYGGQGKEAS